MSFHICYRLREEAAALNPSWRRLIWTEYDQDDVFRRDRAAERKKTSSLLSLAAHTLRSREWNRSESVKEKRECWRAREKRDEWITSGSSYLNPPTTCSVKWELDGVRMDDMNGWGEYRFKGNQPQPTLFISFTVSYINRGQFKLIVRWFMMSVVQISLHVSLPQWWWI